MDITNNTPYAAQLFRSSLPSETEMLGILVAKAVGRFDCYGEFKLDHDSQAPFFMQDTPLDKAMIPHDASLPREGVDVMALGYAYAPTLDGAPWSKIELAVGEDVRTIAVFGERRWVEVSPRQYRPSEPRPFVRMPVSWTRSFGGFSSDEDGETVSHLLNPEGKGYVVCEDEVEGESLPNFEDPSNWIREWTDQPHPCNICPGDNALFLDLMQISQSIQSNQGDPFEVPSNFWNRAHQLFRFRDIAPGTRIQLKGMTFNRAYDFRMPDIRFRATVNVGDRSTELEPTLDSILFFPESDTCIFSYRVAFKYLFVPRQNRAVILD